MCYILSERWIVEKEENADEPWVRESLSDLETLFSPRQRQTIWLRRRYPRCNILACIFQGFGFVSIYIYKKSIANIQQLTQLSLRWDLKEPESHDSSQHMTQFCSKYWQIFQNLVSWTTFCICIKILADKRLVNNLIRGNLLSFPTYTKGQSMNWAKDSQLFLQISKKKKNSAVCCPQSSRKLFNVTFVLDIFGCNVFFSKFSWVTNSDNARLVFFIGPWSS